MIIHNEQNLVYSKNSTIYFAGSKLIYFKQ